MRKIDSAATRLAAKLLQTAAEEKDLTQEDIARLFVALASAIAQSHGLDWSDLTNGLGGSSKGLN